MIQELRHANVPESRILEMLDRYDAESMPSGERGGPDYPGGGPAGAPPQVDTSGATKTLLKMAAGAGIVGGATMLGGVGAAALAPEGYGVLAGIAGQTAGSYGGELARQKLMGEKMSQREARKSAAWTLIPAAAGYGATKVLSAAGGVAPAATEYVGMRSRLVPRYDLTMSEPKPTAELDLGRKISGAVEAQAKPLTPGRIAEEQYIKGATQSGTRVDPQPIIDTLRSKMLSTPRTAGGRNYNNRLSELVDSLEQSKAAGGMTPAELDELIGGELDPSIYRGGKPSGRMTAKGLVPAREAARKSLLGALPEEAAGARTAAAEELTRRELARSYFGGSEKTVTNNIRNLFKPGNEGSIESLRGVSKEAGIDFVEMARDLATKRAFNADDRVKAGMLHRIMLSLGVVGMATGKPGYMMAGLISQPAVARMGAKVLAPMQMLLGPAGAMMSQVYKKQYPLVRETPKVSPHSEKQPTLWKETRATPEQMFPGMTNVGQEK
jgi:hypothetical protein